MLRKSSASNPELSSLRVTKLWCTFTKKYFKIGYAFDATKII